MRGQLVSGYAYTYSGARWKTSKDASWQTIMYTPTGREELVGRRVIDGALVIVFAVGHNKFVGQTASMLGISGG